MGAIGQRLASAVAVQPDMTLTGVAVRSPSTGVLARPDLPYYLSTPKAADALAAQGIRFRGELDDLLASSDVIVDCGQAGTGAERASTYRRIGIKTIYCGGERRGDLGPLVNSALNYDIARRTRSLRLLSCNTTALARVASCVRNDLSTVEAIILRCTPDSHSSAASVLGLVIDEGKSHHSADLRAVLSNVSVNTTSVSVPMSAGHVVHVRLGFRRDLTHDDVTAAFARNPRIWLCAADEALDTAGLIPTPTRRIPPNGPDCRYEVIVRIQPTEGAVEAAAWLSLDQAAITIPETVDAIRGICDGADGDEAKSITDATLGISQATASTGKDQEVLR
jgi:glyceraldehyde-3-phosphate dehydrogenase (NAD(P)+) (phosphorylating)